MRAMYNKEIVKPNQVSWNYIKSRENLYRHFEEKTDKYIIFAHEANIVHICEISKKLPKTAEQIDFETNYKSVWCEIGFYNYGGWYNDLTLNINNRTNTGALTPDANSWYSVYWDCAMPFDAFIAGGHLICDNNVLLGEAVSLSILLPIPPYGYEYPYVDRRRVQANAELDLLMSWDEMKWLNTAISLRFRYFTKREESNANFTLDYYLRKY